MADEKLRIILEVVDKASKTLDNVGSGLSGIGKTVGKLAGKAALGGLGLAVGAAGTAVASLGAGFKLAIDEAMDAEIVMAQLDAVIESTGGAAGLSAQEISDMAGELATMTRFEDDSIISGQNLLLTFTNIGKDVFPDATKAMLDMSTAMGQDMSSSAIQIGKALNDPIKGMTALQRVGVAFTEDQKKMVEGMIEAGDVMGAQKFILAELTKEFGGSAVAAGSTLAGQMDILRNSMSDVAEEAGTTLIPILTEGLQNIAPVLIDLSQKLADFLVSDTFKQWLTDVTTFITEKLVPGLIDIGKFIEEKVIPALENFAKWINETALPAIQGFVDWAKENLFPMFQDMWDWLELNVPAAIETFVNAWKTNVSPNLQTSIDQWNNDLKPAFATLKQIIGTDLPPVLESFRKNWEPIVEVFETIKGLIGWINDNLAILAEKLGVTLPGTGLGGEHIPGPRGGTPTLHAWTMPPQNQAYFPVIVNFNSPVMGFSDQYDLAQTLGPLISEYINNRR